MMLSELDDSIRHLLIHAGGFDPSEVDVAFNIPNREWSAGISKPTLNCYLFDIRENAELRTHGMQTEKHGANGAGRRRPRLFFDLTYLVTAWTRAVEDEHRLLWHTLRTLVQFSSMPEEYLQGVLREHELPIYTKTAHPNGVLKSPGEFWTALENHLKPSLAYVVTVAFDRNMLPAGPPVLTSTFRFHSLEHTREDFVSFGGTIRDDDGAPVPGATVAVEGRAISTVTDELGIFRLHVPDAGRYTLVVHGATGTRRQEVDIPTVTYDVILSAETVPAPKEALRRGARKGGGTTT